jgi:hypothetical protein
VLTLPGFFIVSEGLDLSNWGRLQPVGEYPVRQLGFYEKHFGLMAFWEANPEVLGWLWLIAYATWVGNHFGYIEYTDGFVGLGAISAYGCEMQVTREGETC